MSDLELANEYARKWHASEAECARLQILVERWECESHPWSDSNGDPIRDPAKVRMLIDADEAERDTLAARVAELKKIADMAEAARKEWDAERDRLREAANRFAGAYCHAEGIGDAELAEAYANLIPLLSEGADQ